jgi:hypothetical protein
MPIRPPRAVEKITGGSRTIIAAEHGVEARIGPHPVGGHYQAGKQVLEPGCCRESYRALQCAWESAQQCLGQFLDFRNRIVCESRGPLLRNRRCTSINSCLRYGLAVMAENCIENAFWIIAPLIDDLGTQCRSNRIWQYALGSDCGDGLSHVAGAPAASAYAILKSVGGLSHVMKTGQYRQPCDMYIG